MGVIKARDQDIKILARLMRAEAEGDGEQGMLNAGNTMVNRVRVRCLDFEDITTVEKMAFQSPGGFEAVQKGYFYQHARDKEKRLARKLVQGKRYEPGKYSLWFFRPDGPCPEQWFGYWNSGRYKAHCFFNPLPSECQDVYGTY
ncbi:cell wall hydrolase [Texcoconibacillus texcoconensis]|uniref:N-acetylmuramoyl-L-alanine amidase n=1 Tax=Texcoconibacillus texcoconensis TaxID=1095777 RepID=A0A840QRZ8_9BACI|nr:cell wall hydrolase [Texcoconibacillus texcoconensis]MBB5174135.1 N-acetylmuramoyl-L-alanine amidase [Texcoconibacillus texcoconensis]